MPNQTSTPTPLAEHTANLLFSLFVFIADADEGLSAREVQRLNQMLDDTSWCTGNFMQGGLENLRERYADLWKDYQKKTILRDLPTLADKLGSVVGQPTAPPAGEVFTALREFLDHLSRNSSPTLVRLGLVALSPAKQKARQDVDSLLAQPLADRLVQAATAMPSLVNEARQILSTQTEACRADLSIWPAATLAYSPDLTWKRGKTAVRCVAVIPETHDVKTFVFQAIKPVLFAYKPGQFATLELPIEGKTIRRSYTISSSPSRPHTLSTTVKRVPGGLVSNWLHDNMQTGFEFNLSGPNGDFTCFDAPAHKLLLIAAGSGITPVMSMLRWIVDTSSSANVVFLNNIRTPADVIFGREFEYLGMRMGANLKMGIIPGSVEPGQSWNGPVARFSEHLVRLWAPDFIEREVFVCGPPGYMDCVRSTLERIGYPMHRYHQESFGAPPAQRAAHSGSSAPAAVVANLESAPLAPPSARAVSTPPAAPAATPEKVEIVFSRSSKTIFASAGDFILDLADEHDIKLESSCRAGNCGTCKIRKTEGDVEMDGQQVLSETDILEGYILACIGRACSKRIVLEA
jgi:ferredoxin-NADP reductase